MSLGFGWGMGGDGFLPGGDPSIFPPTASSGGDIGPPLSNLPPYSGPPTSTPGDGSTAGTIAEYLGLALQGFQAYSTNQLANATLNRQGPSTFGIDKNGNPVINTTGVLPGSLSSYLPLLIIIVVVVLLISHR